MDKILKWIGLAILAIFLIINIFILISGRVYIYKGVFNTYLKGKTGPDIYDQNIFYSRTITTGKKQPWSFHESYNKHKITKKKLNGDSLEITSYLVIKDGKLLFEKYWEAANKNKLTNSFSAAKSIVNVLIGIAIQEGKIKSVKQKVGDFLPSYQEGKKNKITIENLLCMSGGLNWDESKSPLSHNAEGYYGEELEELVYGLEVISIPGKEYDYQGGCTLLLSLLLQKATGMNTGDYASQKLWSKIGAEQNALWSLDNEDGQEKAFCCFYATSRDFARIGQLFLNNGNWNGDQILPENYIMKSTVSNHLPDLMDGKIRNNYGWHWWVLNHKDLHVYYARGILGQYIICVPSKKLVIVRTGHIRGEIDHLNHPSDLYLYLDAALEMADKA